MSLCFGVIDVSQSGKADWHPLAHRRLGGVTLLEWVANRMEEAHKLSGVVLIASSPAQQQFIERNIGAHVEVFVSEAADSLARLADFTQARQPHGLVRVCLENCFVDPTRIDHLVETARQNPNCDYISYCTGDGRPAVHATIGIFAEWCAAAAIEQAHRVAQTAAERQDALRFVGGHPELFQARLIQVPSELDRTDVRLAINVEEDLEHIEQIIDALGPDELSPEELGWHRIASLLKDHPAMRERMALLNQQSGS